jgi:hypothetical protein
MPEGAIMRLTIAAALCAATALGACTTTQKVSVVQPGDRAMTCAQLRATFAELENIKSDAQSDQGVNGANVAAVLFFWPAAARNYMDAREASQLVEQRRTHLMAIYNEKNCDNPANADLMIQVPAELLEPIAAGRP